MIQHNRPLSTQRIVTQNLLISAAEAEINPTVSKSSVQDLSNLINLAALYDEILVLGRGNQFHFSGPHSDLVSFLADGKIVKSQALDADISARIALIAKKHLAHYLGLKRIEDFDNLFSFALSPSQAVYGLVGQADTTEDVRIGDLWLKTIPKGVDMLKALETEAQYSRGATFVVRTFLYLACSDFYEIPFVADSARSGVVSTVVKKEDTFFRTRIIQALQEAYKNHQSIAGGEPYELPSPFAAVVFDRCNGQRSRLVKEIERMRAEMRPTREKLRELEREAFWGTDVAAAEAEEKIKDILNEITKNFGSSPGLFSRQRGISFAKESGDVIKDPTSWVAWVKWLSSLPGDIPNRLSARRPVAEIHAFRKKLPGARTVKKHIKDLFGDLKDEDEE